LEKDRINQRVGWQARIHQKNAPEHTAMLTSLPAGAAGYLSNSDRFHSDTVGDEYSARQEARAKQLKIQEFKRNMSLKRDEDRWNQAEQKQVEEDEYYQKLRENTTIGKKNVSNVAYDITTLQYMQSVEGEKQKYADDMVRYRSSLRSQQLIVKGDTRAKYNIISGDDRPQIIQPQPPAKPRG